MGPIETAIRNTCAEGSRLSTPSGRGEFSIAQIDAHGIVLLLGVKEARTSLSWSCIEGVRPFLAGRSWVPIGSRYETVADRRTLDGYLKGCIKRATAGWVAALLERAGIIEIDRQPPARVRLR